MYIINSEGKKINIIKKKLWNFPSDTIELHCSHNQLTSLSELPSSLQKLDCSYNQLTSLPELPPSLQKLDCSYNRLTSLPELPPSLQRLYCSDNQLTSLPELPPSLQRLYCSDNQLTSLPELPPSLQRLYCFGNQLTSLPELPPSLQELYCSNNQLTSLPELPPNLQILYCYNNQLTSLPELPPSLQRLNCHNNQLTSLPELPPSLQRLSHNTNQLISHAALSIEALHEDNPLIEKKELPKLAPETEVEIIANDLKSLREVKAEFTFLGSTMKESEIEKKEREIRTICKFIKKRLTVTECAVILLNASFIIGISVIVVCYLCVSLETFVGVVLALILPGFYIHAYESAKVRIFKNEMAIVDLTLMKLDHFHDKILPSLFPKEAFKREFQC